MHPSLAKIVSKGHCKARSGSFIGIDQDDQIICEGRKCDSIAYEVAWEGAAVSESIVQGILIVECEMMVYVVDILMMGKMERPELRICLASPRNVKNPVKTGSRRCQIDGDQTMRMVTFNAATCQYSPKVGGRIVVGYEGQRHLDTRIADRKCAKLLAERGGTQPLAVRACADVWG